MIKRDIEDLLADCPGVFAQVLIGPRQCGKSTVLSLVAPSEVGVISFDVLQMRTLAESDPALFFVNNPPPLIIDEAQYAPNIFPEIKRIIDDIKGKQIQQEGKITAQIIFRLTGSNQIMLDKHVKETLVGRARYFYLNTLSVREILNADLEVGIKDILFRGGYPELYSNPDLDVVNYLDDYIRSYIEKEIVLSAGITKQREFLTILGMAAARTGGFINYTNIAKDSGIKGNTVKDWLSILERNDLVYLLHPCEPNLNKRLLKTPKLYFLDTGLCSRLQGWNSIESLMKSPNIGSLFETLVLAEIVKTMRNYGYKWSLYLWRTKEGEEVDFVIDMGDGKVVALDAKLGIHNIKPKPLPTAFKKAFPVVERLVIVSYGGDRLVIGRECEQCPIAQLGELLIAEATRQD